MEIVSRCVTRTANQTQRTLPILSTAFMLRMMRPSSVVVTGFWPMYRRHFCSC